MMALHNVTEASLLVETDLMWTSLILVKMVGRAEMSVVVESTADQPSQSAEPAPDENEAPPAAKSQFAGNET
jgi:hypothetical protein